MQLEKAQLPAAIDGGIINKSILKFIHAGIRKLILPDWQLKQEGLPKMKLRNVLIVVKDIERSRQFYHDLFGLEKIVDNDGNMILTEGLVLQEKKYWKEFLGKEIIPENNSCELYFEESNIEGFIEKLEKYYPDVKYVNRLMTHSWGQKVIRFYDPDGNLIEVGTPM